MRTTLYVLLAFALVALNAFFVAAEFAIVKVRRTRIEEMVAKGVHRAQAVRDVIQDLNPYLSACQLGITLASLGLGWVGEPAFAHAIQRFFAFLGERRAIAAHSVAVTIAFALITAMHTILGEIVPKTIAIDRALPTALWVARPLRLFYRVFFPTIWLMNAASNGIVRLMGLEPVREDVRAHSEEELRMIVARSRKGGVLSEERARLLARALDFAAHSVRQIMVPRADTVILDTSRPYEENIRIARNSGHTRYPLCEGDLDQVIGIVHIKDVFMRGDEVQQDLRRVARKPLFVPESLPVDRLLNIFRRHRMHMAVVVDEYGAATGIVTLEDVLEELTGEIQDEFDEEEPKIQRRPDGKLLVTAALPLDEAREHLGLRADRSEGVDTLGGLVYARLGRVPRVGDRIELDGRTVEVASMRGRRILQLLIR